MNRLICSLMFVFLVPACTLTQPDPGPGEPVSWDSLEGWETDRHADAWPALLKSCARLGDHPTWRAACRAAADLEHPTDAQARRFFERYFEPLPLHGEDGGRRGLITGYYEPLLHGSLEPVGPYQYPIYAPPDELLRVELDGVYPELKGKRLRGRLQGRTVVAYPARAQLETTEEALAGKPLLWADDPVDVFFLHVQGSGRVALPDGRVIAVGFADHNGRPYRSIGRRLIELGELAREDVDLFSIRRWLRENPGQAEDLLHHNPRYVFFRLRKEAREAPRGALGVPLTPGRSLAVDRDLIELGSPVWLSTTLPGTPAKPFRRLMMAQDTGGAIRGYARADVFFGLGDRAEALAGRMKQQGHMFLLRPVNGGG